MSGASTGIGQWLPDGPGHVLWGQGPTDLLRLIVRTVRPPYQTGWFDARPP
jgi:hypothetical protein